MASAAESKSVLVKGQARGRHRRANRSISSRVNRLGNESLLRNSAFLVVNLGIGSACGYGAVLLLTRLYSVQAVGLSATAVSAAGLIVFITQFGISYSLPRFLPTSPHRTALINTVLTVVIFAALLGAVVFLALPFAGRLYALGGWLFGAVFVAGVCITAGETVLETILVADRSSRKLATGNVIPNLLKLAAPAIFLFLGALGAYVARIIFVVVAFVVFSTILVRRGHRFRPALSRAVTRELGRFSIGIYLSSLLGSLPLMVLPIIILSRFGPKQSAYWSIAMLIASLLYQLPGTVAQALIPEVAARPSERRYLFRRSAILIIVMVVPVLITAYVAAPWGLAFFGHAYVTETLAPLRWLIIAGFVTILNYLTGTVLILAKKTAAMTLVNAVDAAIVLGMVTMWASGAKDVAISWAMGDIGNTVLIGLFAVMAIRQAGGRLEALGDPHAQAPPQASTAPPSAANPQQRGVDMLIMLAQNQLAWSGQDTISFPIVRS